MSYIHGMYNSTAAIFYETFVFLSNTSYNFHPLHPPFTYVQNTIWMLEKLQQSAGTGARPAAYRDGQNTAIVPFDEFSKMFEEYTSLAAKEKAKRELEISASMTANEGVGRSSGSGDNRRMSLRDITDDEDRFDPDAAMSAVQCLAKEDPLFDSFLKMSLRDKPAGRVSTYYTVLTALQILHT